MFHSLKAQSAFLASSVVSPWLNHLLLAATLNLPFTRPIPVYPAPIGHLADGHSSCHHFLSLTQRSPRQCPLPADGATIHPIPEPGGWPSRLFSPLLPHLQSGTESFRSRIHPLLSLSFCSHVPRSGHLRAKTPRSQSLRCWTPAVGPEADLFPSL